MSGALAVVGSRALVLVSKTVTIDDGGIFGYGYFSGSAIGSISSGTFRSTTITDVASTPSANFGITVNANVPQGFLSRVLVQDGAGVVQTYSAGAATFFTGGGSSSWVWGNGAAPIWAAGDIGEVKTLDIYY